MQVDNKKTNDRANFQNLPFFGRILQATPRSLQSPLAIGVLAGIIAGALWGLVFVAPRMVQGFAAVDVAALRFWAFGAASALLLLSQKLGGKAWQAITPPRDRWLALLGFSILGFTGYYAVLAASIMLAGTAVPALIIGMLPVWVMLLGKPQHMQWRKLALGLAATSLGLGLMIYAEWFAGGALQAAQTQYPHFWWGVGLAIVAMCCWTAFSLLNSRYFQKHRDLDATLWTNWLGVATGVGATLLWLALGSPIAQLRAQPDIAFSVLVCLAMGLLASWLAQWLWNIASQRLSASLCGQLIVSETLFALIYSFMWDGTLPSLSQLLASALFILGIIASIRAHKDE